MDSMTDDVAEAATATSPGNEAEDRDSTDIRAAARGDAKTLSAKARGRDGSPSTASTNSVGFVSPGGDASGGRSTTRSTPRLPTTRRASSEYEGSEVSSTMGSRTGSSRRLFRDSSIGPKNSSTRSVLSLGSSGSINPRTSVSAALKAAGEGDVRSVMQFLNSGGNVNAKCKTGASTPLSRAAAKGRVKVVNLLLDHGAAVNIPGRGGLTPLHEAAGCGQVEVCRVLLGAGAAVAARDHSKRSPLHYAGTSLEATKLLLEFGANPDAQDKNGQRPDAMAVSQEARALLRDARCAVREYAVGDNASRVIASLRRELENLEQEAQAAKESASEEATRRKEVQLEVDNLRGHVSKLSQEIETLKDAATTAPSAQVSEAMQAELIQVRASLRVARAAASEEKRRRENLEESFDSNVAEAVAKAIAVAASRLLDKMPESEEEEEGGAGKRAKREENCAGEGQTWKSAGGSARAAEAEEVEPDHGDGDADLPEPVRALPSVWGGKTKGGGKGDADADADADVDADADGSGDGEGSDAEGMEDEQDGKGFAVERVDELLETTAGALLPHPMILRRCYSVGATPPRQEARNLSRVSSKGYGSGGSKSNTGCPGGDAEEEEGFCEGGLLKVKSRSLENVLQAEHSGGIKSGQLSPATRGSSAWAPLGTFGAGWTGTEEDHEDERGTAPGDAASPSAASEDRAQNAGIGECSSPSLDRENGGDSVDVEAIVNPPTVEPDDVAATVAVAGGPAGESSASPAGGAGVNAEPDAARGDASRGDCVVEEVLIHPSLQSTIAYRQHSSALPQFQLLENVVQAESTGRIERGQPSPATSGSSGQAPLGTVAAGWTGTDKENQGERGTAPGDAAPPSTTSEDRVQNAGIGECSPPSREEDGDDSIHVEAVIDSSTVEPDDIAAALATAESALTESSVSPGHGIRVSAERDAACRDGAETAAEQRGGGREGEQEEDAAPGRLGGDVVPSVLEDLAEDMVAASEAEDEDDYYDEDDDDDDYYDDDDDDDEVDFLNYLCKYEMENSEGVGQTTDARVWEGLAAAIKVELEEKKARISDLSIENRRLRREAAAWAEQCAIQKEQNHHEQLQQQQQQQQQQQWWWQQWWWQQEDVEISLHERVGMCEPKPERGILGRMFQGIPRVAHVYWEH